MKKFTIKGVSLFVAVVMLSTSIGLMAATKNQAKAMAKKVEAYYKTHGKEKTMAEVQKDKGQFEKGEIYVYVFDFNGTVLAHPKLPSWVGKSFKSLKDADGKFFIQEAISTLQNQNECWIDYKWNNPKTKKIGLKHGYFLKAGDFIISCGIWK